MEEKNYTVKDYIIGGIFLIWFIGSIAALFMTVKISPWLALSVFGQYFLVFGFIALFSGLKNGDYKPIFLIFILVGLLAVLFGVVMCFGDETTKAVMQQCIPYAGVSIFFFTGILCIINYYVRKKSEEKCTMPVLATCIDIRRRHRDTYEGTSRCSNYLYCPVYSYTYDGKSYEVSTNFFSNTVNTEVGEQCDLFIDPKKPKCFKEEGESARQSGVEWGLGIFFTVLSSIIFIVLLVTG